MNNKIIQTGTAITIIMLKKLNTFIKNTPGGCKNEEGVQQLLNSVTWNHRINKFFQVIEEEKV